MRRVALLLAFACLLGLTGSASAITPPSGFIDTTLVTGLSAPTSMVWDPASARLFVTEQGGNLRVVKDGVLLDAPFVHLNVNSSGERGLLGVELDPNFASNHFVYVYYTPSSSPRHNRVSRFTAQGDVAASGSEQVLLDLNNLSSATNHNGGAVHFGGDGKLYIAHGDNADGANSQSMTTLLGKMLRMNSDGTIPTDNPFYNTATGQNRLIWALGLRNPFTFAVQPATGRIVIDDVGQSAYEEIDDGAAGANYGWPDEEGPGPNPAYTDPLFYYAHSGNPTPNGCAITGGTFYNPPVAYFPAQYVGRYFFSDLCGGWIEQLDPGNGNAVSDFADGGNSPVDLDTGPDGSLYYLENGGRVGRISYEDNPTANGPVPAAGPVGAKVTLDGTYLAGATGVTFSGTPASFAIVWDTRIVATVPAGATTGPIEVTTGAGTAQTGAFTVTPIPAVLSSFSPNHGPAGTKVTIKGSLLTGTTSVEFNGTPAASFTVKSDKQIVAVLAPGTTTGTITIDGAHGPTTSAAPFVVPPPPTVTSFLPTSGPVGTKFTITGTGFKAGGLSLTINGVKANANATSNTTIAAKVKTGTSSGQIAVTTKNGTGVSAGTFTVS